MIKELTKLANHLDSKGFLREADYVDNVITKSALSAETKFSALLKRLSEALVGWEEKEYDSDRHRYESYYEDIKSLLEKYDPDAHPGETCEEAHPDKKHSE